MAGGSSGGGGGGGGNPRRKNSRANRSQNALNRSNDSMSSSNSTTSPVNSTANEPTTNTTTKVKPLAPPATDRTWMVKNPISLVLEVGLIFFMFLVTVYFKMFRVFLPKSKKSVTGQVVLITGTGRGLGRELALQFAKLGAKVACVDVDQDSNEETVKLIEADTPGATVKAYTVNVAARSEIAELAVKVELDLGPVEILINNAAVIIGHTFLGAQDHTIAAIININLMGHFWMIRTFLPSMMKRNSGHIVAMSSISALCGVPKLSAYTASKWGVNGMMESLREELREHPHNQIKTTVVMPELINTSADYMNYINSRLPVLSVEHAAKSTIQGILTDEVEFVIPYSQYFTNIIRRLLPINISDSIKNIFYVKVVLPPKESQVNQQNMAIVNRTPAVN